MKKKKTEQWSVSEWVLNEKCSRWFMGFKTCSWIGGSSLLCRPPSWQQWNNMISLLVFLKKNRWSGSQKNRFGAEWSFQSYLLLSSNKTFFFELFQIKYWAWIYSKCLDGNKFAVLIDCVFLLQSFVPVTLSSQKQHVCNDIGQKRRTVTQSTTICALCLSSAPFNWTLVVSF